MSASRWHPGAAVVAAMLSSGAIGAQFVAGRAARDALFLAYHDRGALARMTIATSVFAIVLVVLSPIVLRRVSPARWVPVAFAANAAVLAGLWGLAAAAPSPAGVIVYLMVSGLGPMLASGFWLIASERIDPHTAKQRFGQIAGAGTFGGLLGGLVGTLIASLESVTAMLPFLAALNLVSAWLVRRLGRSTPGRGAPPRAAASPPEPARAAFRVLAEAPYLRSLAALVLVGTIGAVLVDLLFKAQAKETFVGGPSLLRFFSVYYNATSVMTFGLQTSAGRFALQKFGLAAATSTPSLALLAGGLGGLLVPGLSSVVAARGGESVLRGSLYRSGYELFYTPIQARDKRSVKSLIDVGFDRFGDFIGASLYSLILVLPADRQATAILSTAMACATVGLVVARGLRRGYVRTLEQRLLNHAVEIDLSDVEDLTTKTTVLNTLRLSRGSLPLVAHGGPRGTGSSGPGEPGGRPLIGAVATDQEMQDSQALRSRDLENVLRVLRQGSGLTASLVPHVIPLLAWDDVANDAMRALRTVAEERIGELTDALLDPNEEFAVRRRLARVFSVCVSQRAADGLLLGLEDLRFEVRYRCGRSLLAIAEKNPGVRIDQVRVFAIVSKEVAVNHEVWANRRLLDEADEGDQRSFLDELVRARASQSLAHVFTLLALVLPSEPLRVAFRALHTDDQGLRGTALEYLEGVLPADIRERLWPFLESRRPVRPPARPREDVLADLLRSRPSIAINLEALRHRADARQDAQAE